MNKSRLNEFFNTKSGGGGLVISGIYGRGKTWVDLAESLSGMGYL